MKRCDGPLAGFAVAALAFGAATAADSSAMVDGRADFADTRDPPSWSTLDAAERERYDLGHALSNTLWLPAGTSNAARRDGLGPLFNAASCDACHNEGARGQGLAKDGSAPAAMVIQLRRRGARNDDRADPVYGHALNTSALEGFRPEAEVRVRYAERGGDYPDGMRWSLRAPTYELLSLSSGPLAGDTVFAPRLTPQLFGAGLLERVPDAFLRDSAARARGRLSRLADGRIGRFGWQATTATIEEQTAVALSREMGLTSPLIDRDDCTPRQAACRAAPSGGTPEVPTEFMQALVAFQRHLAVPRAKAAPDQSARFAALGCAACHRPRLPVDGVPGLVAIAPYTDLLLHDLGDGLADRDANGRSVPSTWRTAPLWGLGHAARRPLALLHDGRARSIEEAVLWHDGEARTARRRFEQLDAAQRRRMLDWLAAL